MWPLRSGVRHGRENLARLVDLQGNWAFAIGNAFVAFGSIEHTVVICVRAIPRDKFQRFTNSLKLSQRVELLLDLLEGRSEPECIELSKMLEQVTVLAKTRNLIAHNPLVLQLYEEPNGEYRLTEAISAIHKPGHQISLAAVQAFAAESQELATQLIGASRRCFRALGITPDA